MSYIGIIGAKRLDDSNASLGLIEAQKKAVQLLRCSTDMHMIKQQTGWEMGVDGKCAMKWQTLSTILSK